MDRIIVFDNGFLLRDVPYGSTSLSAGVSGEERVLSDPVDQALFEARGGRPADAAAPLLREDMLFPKLWETPCWFSFRINYLAQLFNEPVYGRINALHDLLRPEFVILYSLYLRDGLALSEVGKSSAFPRNTLSRAAQKLLQRGLVRREGDPGDQRRALLFLTPAGREIVAGEMEPMMTREAQMLTVLSPAERLTLSDLLAKLVAASGALPDDIDGDSTAEEMPEMPPSVRRAN